MLASQAEKARRITGRAEKPIEANVSAHKERAIKRDSIIPSRQRRAERRCERWKVSPDSPNIKAAEKEKWIGVIRQLWNLTVIF